MPDAEKTPPPAAAPETPRATASRPHRAEVAAPARLHFGFLDLNYGLGRKFVGLGMAVSGPVTRIVLERAAHTEAVGPDSGRARHHLESLIARHGASSAFRLVVEEALPAHCGLGSGTQLALAVASAFAALEQPGLTPEAIARSLGRAERSAIGIASFLSGGVILDGGRGPATEVPPVLSRLPFPPAWRVILIFDHGLEGVHGEAERQAFATLPPFPPEVSAELCRLVLVRALPALAEADFAGFASVIGTLQRRVGDHFAPAQGGGRFASPMVTEVLDIVAAEGLEGIGQTSWGPTGFALVPDADGAERLAHRLRTRFKERSALEIRVVAGRNIGATIRAV